MRLIVIYLALCCGLLAQTTKVGGSGTTKVGGSGTTKVSGVAGPTTIATDTFIRGGGYPLDPITNPMSDGSSTWTTAVIGGHGVTMKIQSASKARASSAGDGLALVSSASPIANQYSEIIIDGSGGPNSAMGVLFQSGAYSGYTGYINSSTQVIITKWTAGVSATITTITTSTITNNVTRVGLYGSVSGGTVTLTVYIDGVLQAGSGSDSSSPYLTGVPAMYSDGNGGSITNFVAKTGP